MKYIKIYEAYDEDSISDAIDKNLISDLKDLGLDMLDNGYCLFIIFINKHNNIPSGEVRINHNEERYQTYWSFNNKNRFYKYTFNFYKDISCNMSSFFETEDIEELEDILRRIRIMYPKHDIKIRNT